MEAVYRLYADLARGLDPEHGLGGRLLYAGELDAAGCRLVRAANIAGAASLAATADAATARQAMREGAIDFVVTSLDEALRILKNEIRKRQPVAVGVTVAPFAMEAEMAERGVQPDLLPPASSVLVPDYAAFLARGARRVQAVQLPTGMRWITVPVQAAGAQQTAAFEALLQQIVPPENTAGRRWLRLAPRYLGPRARRLRGLACDEAGVARLAELPGSSAPGKAE